MKMLSACLLLLPFISCTQVQDTKNDAVIEQKIEALLSRMTLEDLSSTYKCNFLGADNKQ